MNRRILWILLASAASIIYVAWAATEPNPFFHDPDGSIGPRPYDWPYVAFAVAYAGLLFALLRPWRTAHPFVGSAIASAMTLGLFVLFFFTVMHASPAHDAVLYCLFFAMLAMFAYSGFCLAHWRMRRGDEQDAA